MSGELDRSVAGDKDRWILFSREFSDGTPLVVVGRTGNPLIEEGLDESTITIVDCCAEDRLINQKGMPQETDRLYAIEEHLADELEALRVNALHIASVTGNGVRRIFFIHDLPVDFDALLRDLKVSGYSFSTTIAKDSHQLRSLIVPTDLDRQIDGDRQVIYSIEEKGDDGLEPRQTDFWFYGEKIALELVSVELQSWGFSLDHWLEKDEGLVVSLHTPVDLTTFEQLTPILLATADKHGVTYDGWETCVINSDNGSPIQSENAKPVSLLSKLFGAKKN